MKGQRIFFFGVIVIAVLAIVAYVAKMNAAKPLLQSSNFALTQESKSQGESHEVNDSPLFQGKIIELNTNANKITFIKIRDKTTSNEISYMSTLNSKDLDLRLGDVVEFSKDLPISSNGNYFLIKSTVDFKVLEKNKADTIKVDKVIPVDEITEDLQGVEIITSAKISDLYTSGKGHSFFQIYNDKKTIKGVLFAAEAGQLKPRLDLIESASTSHENLNIKGKVAIYKGELEIIVSKVWK